ncbi:9826_t:CDS:2, partial [Scutellospora calospora]
ANDLESIIWENLFLQADDGIYLQRTGNPTANNPSWSTVSALYLGGIKNGPLIPDNSDRIPSITNESSLIVVNSDEKLIFESLK